MLGPLIERERKRLRLSAEALARQVHVSRMQIYRIESGEQVPSLETFAALCEALHIDPRHALTLL